MKISFFSNYLTHHQIPFCLAMQATKDVEFYFVATQPMEEERKLGGWSFNEKYAFEVKAYESDASKELAMQLAKDSDVMIIGSAPEEYVTHRMKHANIKLTLRYSERIYKAGRWRVLSPRGLINRFKTYFRYIGKPLYMLCASAYTAGDLAMLGSYVGKCFKWGYFPKSYTYDIDNLLEKKEIGSILWVARLIDWKHPELPIMVAKKLKENGYSFNLNMIGVGPMQSQLEDMIADHRLNDCVHLLGAMSPDDVRAHMEKSRIFLFTSDMKEGWGAVLNEAMNSGCAVVANGAIGSVPFLLKDGENGHVYRDKGIYDIYKKTIDLLSNEDKQVRFGKNAYETITEIWSAEVAADRLINICKGLLDGKKEFYDDGPCSKAKISVKKG